MSEPSSSRPLVSLVVPVDNAAEHVEGLLALLRELVAAHPERGFELVLVDDGSSDGGADRLLAGARPDEVIRVATLTRAFGSSAALRAGLALARGDAVLVLDAASPGSAATIGRLLGQWRGSGARSAGAPGGHDVVWAAPAARPGRLRALVRRVPGLPVVPGEWVTQLLVDRGVLDVVQSAPQRPRDLVAAIGKAGGRQTTVVVDAPRARGRGEALRRTWGWFTGLYSAPFLVLLLLGLAVTAAGLVAGIGYLLLALVAKTKVWSLVVSTVLFVGGLNLAALGGFGEYLWRSGANHEHPSYVLSAVRDHGPTTPTSDRRA